MTDTESLNRPRIILGERSNFLQDLLLDLQRAFLLIWMLLVTAVPLLLRRLVWIHDDPAVLGARLRQSFQRLGITYIKLGQFLAMRFDLLPEEVCRELAGLFDNVPPMSSQAIRQTLETEFSRPIDELFRDFDWQCIAAASVAQVHKAMTQDGRLAAVKIQRPGISSIFTADIRNFRRLARMGDYLQLFGPQSIVEAVNEFERYTLREMDFMIEGRTADRLRSNAGPGEDSPRVYWELTTTRVLTTELVEGYPLSEIIHFIERGDKAGLERIAPGLDLQLALRNFAWACMRQLFVTGFFHADPHPGNIFLRQDGTVVFVDFGIFGQLTSERREIFASYIENLAVGNVAQSYQHFVKLLQPTIQTDMLQLRRDVHQIMHRWHKASQETEATVSERHLGTYFSEFITAIRNNKIQMSMDTLLFWRAILTLDATALRFGGHFDLLGALREFFKETRPTPLERLLSLSANQALAASLLKLKQEAPQRLGTLVETLSRQRYQLSVLQSTTPFGEQADGSTSLIVLAIIGGSVAMLLVKLPGVFGRAILWVTMLSLATAILIRLVRR